MNTPCPNCRDQVADTSPACPNCGCAIYVEHPGDMKRVKHKPYKTPESMIAPALVVADFLARPVFG